MAEKKQKTSLDFKIYLLKRQIAKYRYAIHRAVNKKEQQRIERKIIDLMTELRKLQKEKVRQKNY